MANHWTIGKKLFTGIGVLVALLLLSGTVAIWSSSMLKEHLDTAIMKTTPKVDLAHRIQENVVRLRSEQRRALSAVQSDDMETVAKAASRVDEISKMNQERLDEMGKLIVTEEGKRTIAEIRKTHRRLARNRPRGARVHAKEAERRGEGSRSIQGQPADRRDRQARRRAAGPARAVPEGIRGGSRSQLLTGPNGRHRPPDRLAAGGGGDRVLGAGHHRDAATDGEPLARSVGAGGGGLVAGVDLGAVALAGRHGAGGVARGVVGVDGGDGVDDAAERGERAAGVRADGGSRPPGDREQPDARARWCRR